MEKRIAEFNCAKMLDEHFDHPHKNYPTILVGGTDGKGSTSSMIASILMSAGYKVGAFNTPGIISNNDTIKINGVPINTRELKTLTNTIKREARIKYIDIVRWVNVYVEAALLYFQKENVDIAVIECCKGIATDPTNVVEPIVSVLTNITPDHLEVFGNSFENYLQDKMGIVKPKTPCIIGEISEAIKKLLIEKALSLDSKLVFADSQENKTIIESCGEGVHKTIFGTINCDLAGDYQKHNINVALNVTKELIKQGYNITNEHIINGLNNVVTNSGLKGRFQYLKKEPKIILDVGHTPAAWKKLTIQLQNIKCKKLHVFVVCYNNRDVEEICRLLPDEYHIKYYFPISTFKRLRKPDELMDTTSWMCKSKRQVTTYVGKAVEELMKTCDKEDVIFICGCTEYSILSSVKFN